MTQEEIRKHERATRKSDYLASVGQSHTWAEKQTLEREPDAGEPARPPTPPARSSSTSAEMAIANYILKCLALVVACGYLYVYWLQTDNNRYASANTTGTLLIDKKTGMLFQISKGSWIQADPKTASHVKRSIHFPAPASNDGEMPFSERLQRAREIDAARESKGTP